MDAYIAWDLAVFFFINRLPHVFAADQAALLLSAAGGYGLVWLGIGAWIYLREESKDRTFAAVSLAVVAGSAWVTDSVLKPLIARSRPATDMGAIVIPPEPYSYSFPSGHATVAWAMAVWLGQYEPRYRVALYVLAGLISLSRVYLGVHYPSDILAGAVIGSIIGTAATHMHRFVIKKRSKKPARR